MPVDHLRIHNVNRTYQHMKKRRRKILSMGVELETYSIALPEYRICRELHFPKRSIIEDGERFTRDASIGPEYNSKVFTTIREAFFLLKSSLRKYTCFTGPEENKARFGIFPVGSWIDRFAGTHVHLALGRQKFSYELARDLAAKIHDHIPFLIALAANSPVRREKITAVASNRLLRGSDQYCRVTKRGFLYKNPYREMTFNKGRKTKPPTLEIRVFDSSIPEYIAAVLVLCKAVAQRWIARGHSHNRSTHENYLSARESAIRKGVRARLVWSNHSVGVADYTDLFFRKYREELEQMDIPDEVLRVFKYLKKGWNQAEIMQQAAERCWGRHAPTWQRQFARRYATAIRELLDGNSLEQFAKRLGVKLPEIGRTWLGRKEFRW